MIWDILEKKLLDAGLVSNGNGQTKRSLFRFTMPPDVEIGVMMRNPLTGITIDQNMPGWFRPKLQVIVRHKDVVMGNTLANQVMDALTVQGEQIFPASAERGMAKIAMFYPNALPIQFPRLDGNGYEWSLNFDTAFAIAPA